MPGWTTTLFSNLNIQTVLVGVIVILIIKTVRQRLKYKFPPGPFAWPLIGNLEVIREKFVHKKLTEYKEKYGPVFQVFLGEDGIVTEFYKKYCEVIKDDMYELFQEIFTNNRLSDSQYKGPARAVVLNDIKVVTEALITQKADFTNRPQSPSIMLLTEGGKDIAMANYTPTWKLHRKIAGKALRQYMTGNHFDGVVHKSMEKCLKLMAEQAGSFDPEKYVDLMIFNILDAVIFGESAELENPEFQRLIKLKKEATELFGSFFLEDMLPILVKIRPTAKYRRLKETVNEFLEIFRHKFQQHEKTFDQENLRDFTDALLLARKEASEEENEDMMSKLTETHLMQTLGDIFFAGIDTSRVTISFAIRYMASLPDIQSKVQEEIDKAVGKDRFPGSEDRKKLQYAEATLHEVMRLGMAVPLGVPHVTACDTAVGGYDIPKNTMVMINHWALHHDPNYWKDVDTFDPKRYLDEHGDLTMKPESWLPFSMGRRVCLGETVAKPELHLIFCCILQRFNISLAPGTNPEIEFDGSSATLYPASYKINVEERK